MTAYQRHVARWKNCKRCNLCEQRQTVVLARGRVPCDVLFVGEAPGVSEDVLGVPFVGPAGKLMDEAIRIALDGQHDYALTNLICCVPLDEDGAKAKEPPKEAILACEGRLKEFTVLCRPRLVVTVGKLADKHFEVPQDIPVPLIINVVHPAAILRMDVSQKGLAFQRMVVTIRDTVEELEEG